MAKEHAGILEPHAAKFLRVRAHRTRSEFSCTRRISAVETSFYCRLPYFLLFAADTLWVRDFEKNDAYVVTASAGAAPIWIFLLNWRTWGLETLHILFFPYNLLRNSIFLLNSSFSLYFSCRDCTGAGARAPDNGFPLGLVGYALCPPAKIFLRKSKQITARKRLSPFRLLRTFPPRPVSAYLSCLFSFFLPAGHRPQATWLLSPDSHNKQITPPSPISNAFPLT